MVVQRPFNEAALWKGKIQKACYPSPVPQPPFVMPVTNWLTGIVAHPPDLSSEMTRSYSDYSKAYWLGVKKRHAQYRDFYRYR